MRFLRKMLLTRYELQQVAIDACENEVLMEVRSEDNIRNILRLKRVPNRYAADLVQLYVTRQVSQDGIRWKDVSIHEYKAFAADVCEDEFPARSYDSIIRRMMAF